MRLRLMICSGFAIGMMSLVGCGEESRRPSSVASYQPNNKSQTGQADGVGSGYNVAADRALQAKPGLVR